MPDYSYFKIDSWHIVDEDKPPTTSLCGKTLGPGLTANVKDSYPASQASCESCLRIATSESEPKTEKPKVESDPEAADPAVAEEY